MDEMPAIPPEDPARRKEWEKEVTALVACVTAYHEAAQKDKKPGADRGLMREMDRGFKEWQIYRECMGDAEETRRLFRDWLLGGQSHPPEVISWLNREAARIRALSPQRAVAPIKQVHEEAGTSSPQPHVQAAD